MLTSCAVREMEGLEEIDVSPRIVSPFLAGDACAGVVNIGRALNEYWVNLHRTKQSNTGLTYLRRSCWWE